MESEMDKAKDHHGMTGTEFHKDKHSSRPSSVMSNNSSKTHDPYMGNSHINQSTSFKRLMYSVLGEAEMWISLKSYKKHWIFFACPADDILKLS